MRTEKIETAVLAQQPQQSVAYYPQSDETSLLMEEDPQAELECTYSNTNTAGETTVLNTGGSPMYGQTVLLEKDPDQIFEIEFEIAYLHSEVLIE
jgi:hypothetical protein